MDEQDLVAELFEELTWVYDDRVRSHYALGPDSKPDIVVLDEDGSPYLIGEVKADSDKESQWNAFDHLRHYKSQSSTTFFGFFTHEISYIYRELNVDGLNLQISSGEPPQDRTDLNKRRGFRSSTELQFCYNQSSQLCKKELGKEVSIEGFLHELQRLVVAEESQQEISVWEEEFADQINDIDRDLEDQYPFYSGSNEEDIQHSRIIQAVLNGYSIAETEDIVISEFISQASALFSDPSSHGTPVSSARYIARRLDIQPDDRVLDPAMGWGNILREITTTTPESDCHGIEINSEVAQTASALNTITNSNISIQVSDGIKTAWNEESFRSSFDHVILDPPIGLQISKDELPEELSNWENSKIEDVFVASSLNYLKQDGLLTAIVPLGLLSRSGSERLRDKLIEEYHIESVIEVDNGSFYESVRSDLAVIQISNRQTSGTAPTEFVVLDHLKEPEGGPIEPEVNQRLEISVSEVPNKTLIPNKVIAQHKVQNRLGEIYSDFTVLNEVCSGFRRGKRLPSELLGPEGDLQYLQISDVTGEAETQRFIDEDGSEDLITAGPSDLLISAAGTIDIPYIPEKEVIPHSNWVIIRFESEALARIYQGFFCTSEGQRLLRSLATGSTIPHLSISVLQDIDVPDFRNHSSLDEATTELAKIEELKQGRIDQSDEDKIKELLEEGV